MTVRPEPGDRPPPGRLDRPPGDRYRPSEDATPPPRPRSAARGLALGTAAGIGGAAAIVLLGGLVAVSIGLLVVAGATGWLVAEALRTGGGDRIQASLRRAAAVSIAVLSVAGGQVGLWVVARAEGGTLGLADYLGQTFGWLVPAELILAAVAARWAAR